MGLRIGVDVGGTFTDLCLFDDRSRSLRIVKVPSVPSSPEEAIISGVQRILSEGRHPPEEIEFFRFYECSHTGSDFGGKIGEFPPNHSLQ